MSRGEPVPDRVAVLGGGKLVHRLIHQPTIFDPTRLVTRCGTRIGPKDRLFAVEAPEAAGARCGRCERDAARRGA